MILHLKEGISPKKIDEIAKSINALHIQGPYPVLINSFRYKTIPPELNDYVEDSFSFDSDIQLASRDYQAKTRKIRVGKKEIGGATKNTLVITGPCSVESREQIKKCASFNQSLGITMLRAGCFKPRTSPYTFQGLGVEGLELLDEIREKYDLQIITEIRDASHADEVISITDVIQVGAKAMYDQGILRKCGTAGKPVLLKRGFGATIQEFVQAAEFVLSLGNQQVVLCERGIRTFETKTRFTLDLTGVAYLKKYVNLPVFLDPSHAMGYAYGVPDLTRACVAMGIDGLLIESHPDPTNALSDASQQLDFDTFKTMYKSLNAVAQSVERTIV